MSKSNRKRKSKELKCSDFNHGPFVSVEFSISLFQILFIFFGLSYRKTKYNVDWKSLCVLMLRNPN